MGLFSLFVILLFGMGCVSCGGVATESRPTSTPDVPRAHGAAGHWASNSAFGTGHNARALLRAHMDRETRGSWTGGRAAPREERAARRIAAASPRLSETLRAPGYGASTPSVDRPRGA